MTDPSPRSSVASPGGASRWLDAAAYGTWAVCGVVPIADMVAGRFTPPRAWWWLGAFLVFGMALVATMYGAGAIRRRGGPALLALVVIQSAAGLAMVYYTGTLAAAALVIVAAQLPNVVSYTTGVAWVAVQTAGLAVVVAYLAGWRAVIAAALALGGFQVFALAMSLFARRARQAHDELARINRELMDARALLADNARAAERLRIARDLHDTLGHHLTALSLELDVASRLATGDSGSHIARAYAIARLLLADVRDVVSRTREAPLDAAPALRRLAETAGGVAVHLEAPASLLFDDAARGQAIERCVQEVITNAMRHGEARHLWIRIAADAAGVHIEARDDGRGCAHVVEGHGLTGMRERFAAVGGRVDVSAVDGGGFTVRAFIPAVSGS